jgi:hypothetical protein
MVEGQLRSIVLARVAIDCGGLEAVGRQLRGAIVVGSKLLHLLSLVNLAD